MTDRKASDAAIERVAERWGHWPSNYGEYTYNKFTRECDREQELSDALRAHFGADVPASLAGYVLPVVVDPIVEMVREAMATQEEKGGNFAAAGNARAGDFDKSYTAQVALSVARAIAAQGGGL